MPPPTKKKTTKPVRPSKPGKSSRPEKQHQPSSPSLSALWLEIDQAIPKSGDDLLQHIQEYGKNLLAFGQLFSTDDFSNSLNKTFAPSLSAASMPFRVWQTTTQSLLNDATINQPFNGELPTELNELITATMRAPESGNTHETVSQNAGILQSLTEYNKQLTLYGSFCNEVLLAAHSLFQKSLESDSSITNVRSAYNRWVDCCETEYAKRVQSEEYAQHYGKLVNALIRVRAAWNNVVEGQSVVAGRNTLNEHKSAYRRIDQLRRKCLEKDRDIEALRKRIEQLESRLEKVLSVKTAVRHGKKSKTVRKKKVTEK